MKRDTLPSSLHAGMAILDALVALTLMTDVCISFDSEPGHFGMGFSW